MGRWELVGESPERKPRRRSGCRSVTLALMLVILGIPTVIAYKAYRDLIFLRQGSEGRSLAEGVRNSVSDYYAKNHDFPLDNRQAGLPEPRAIRGKFVSEVAVANGSVTVIFSSSADERLADRKLVFSPHAEGNRLTWSCASGAETAAKGSSLPSICRH